MINLRETLENASLLHAAVVHFPIVLFTFAVPVAILALLFQRHTWVHAVNALLFIVLVVSCVVAERTGELAYAKVPTQFDQAIWDQINEHEAMAAALKFIAAAGALVAALGIIPLPAFRVGGALVSLCVAVGGLFATMVAAHFGGDLVYRYGVGTQVAEQQVLQAAQAAAPSPAGGAAAASGAAAPKGEDAKEMFATLKPIDREAAAKVSFSKDVWPILEAKCLSCHDTDDAEGNYIVRTVEALKQPGEKSGPGVIPGQPDESPIVKYITGELQPRMPKRKPPLPEDELNTIRMWIAAGALDDSAAATPAATPPSPAPEPAPAIATPVETTSPEASAPQPPPASEPAVMQIQEVPVPAPAAEAPVNMEPAPPVANALHDPFSANGQ